MGDTRRAIHFEITASNEDIKKKLTETRRQLLDSGKAAEAMADQVHSAFQRATTNAFEGFSAGAFVKQIATVRGEFQMFEAVLANTLQSTTKAQQTMTMIQDFAAKTPFQVNALTGAFVKLANEGFVPTYEQMTRLGDLGECYGQRIVVLKYCY